MPKIQAWEKLNDPEFCSDLSMETFYELLITAGYPEDDAQEAASKHGWNRLSAGKIL